MPHNKIVFEWFDANVDVFSPASSMLYVGWRPGSKLWWLEEFGPAIGAERMALLEIFKSNYDAYDHGEKFLGDLADLDEMFEPGEWHTVFFDHGPEHAPDEKWLEDVTGMLKENVGHCIIYACPWGECGQGVLYNNERERHATTVYEKTFEDLGMDEIRTFGKPDTGAAGEIIGWWKKEQRH